MATLNTLRTKGGWIVSIVIAIALLAFLLGDLTGTHSVFGVKEKVGSIDGTSISYIEYAQEIDYQTNINKIMSGTDALSQEQTDAIKNFAWEMMINNYAIFPGYKKMGIEVSEAEMLDLIYGDHISPVLEGAGLFNNQQTGAYDKTLVRNFVTNLSLDQSGQMRALWQYMQSQVRINALMSKYMGLVANMVYVTDLEAKQGVEYANNYYNARYVGKTYDSVPDSTIKVTTAEAKKYYESHKNYFKQTASRDVEYVVFEVAPSTQDYADAKKAVDVLAAEFAETDNVQQYVTLNSQEAFNPSYFKPEQLSAELAAFAFDRNSAGVYGPVLEGDTYTISRVSDLRSFPDTIAMRQMLLPMGSETLADSIVTVLKRGADFTQIALEHSMIPAEGIDVGRISTQMFDPSMGEQIYSVSDKIIKLDTPNGIAIFDVYYRGPVSPKVQIGEVKYYIEPSSVTQQAAYAKASGFIAQVQGSSDQYNKVVADSVYSKRVARIRSSDNTVSGLTNARELIRWAFNAKVNDVSQIMEVDGNYLIATMTQAREDGFTPMNLVTTEIASAVRRQRKAEILSAQMQGAQSIDALAQTLSAEAGEITELNFNTFYIPELGVDPNVIGAICGGVPEGKLSKPINGMTGVYVVEITSKEVRDEATVEMEKVRLEANGQNYIDQRAIQALQDLSNVVDTRAKYF